MVEYLQQGVLPDSHKEARKVRIKALLYITIEGSPYRKGFVTPWLKCIDEAKGKEELQETHVGPSGTHEGARTLIGKIL